MINASPLGMDLGEFLLEGDLEFWNQITMAQQAQMSTKIPGAAINTSGIGQADSGGSLLL